MRHKGNQFGEMVCYEIVNYDGEQVAFIILKKYNFQGLQEMLVAYCNVKIILRNCHVIVNPKVIKYP